MHAPILSYIARRILTASMVFVVILACDRFDHDEIVSVASIVPLSEVTLYQNGEAIIPISTSVSSPVQVTITCTQQPKRGYVEVQRNGNFKYVPYINESGTDNVVFSVRSMVNNEELLPPQEVDITIRPRQEGSSCLPIAVADVLTTIIYYDYDYYDELRIDVTANDRLCHSNYDISIYKPTAQWMPHAGVATINSESPDSSLPVIRYKGTGPSWVTDTIMYKVIDRQNPHSAAYGIVYILPECKPTLRDDFVAPGPNNVWSPFYPLLNDDICDPLYNYAGVFSIVQFPKHGELDYLSDYYYYDYGELLDGAIEFRNTDQTPWTYDTIVYKLCETPSTCNSARIIVSNQPSECAPVARTDRFSYRDDGSSSFNFSVLDNDEICGGSPVLSIRYQSQHGIAEVDVDGRSIRYTPARMLSDSFEYAICTEKGCSIAVVYIDHK